jgi:AraC-like DNA-binding protein
MKIIRFSAARRAVRAKTFTGNTRKYLLDLTELRKWAKLSRYRPGGLAKIAGRTQRQLHRDFVAALGCSPHSWLADRRLMDVQQRLRSGEAVKHVSADAHFQEVSSFCHWFKSKAG